MILQQCYNLQVQHFTFEYMCNDEDNKFSKLAIVSDFLFLIYNTNVVIKVSSVIYIMYCFGVQRSVIEFSIFLLSNVNRVIVVSNGFKFSYMQG